MAKPPYTPPTLKADAFNCPHCHAFANQSWSSPTLVAFGTTYTEQAWLTCRCSRCRATALWIGERMVYPSTSAVEDPNPDLAPDAQADYDEARAIVTVSPRGAAALLRLAIQKTCIQLGLPGKNINDDIGALVKAGLHPTVQQALDTVRVVGNNAVHPGQIDLKDDTSTATKLFALVNLIADVMVTQPKHVQALYESIVPEGARAAIDKRDGR